MSGRGTTLEQMLYDLRSECGQSTNPAVSRSTRARFINLLNRVQKRLWYDYDWPFLEVHRDIKLQAGQRYYDFPTDIDMDRTVRFETYWGGEWQKMGFGIDGRHYTQYNSEGDAIELSDPAWRWGYFLEPGEIQPQFEVWPVPATNGADPVDDEIPAFDGYIRVYGTVKLKPMVSDQDVCLLDSDMIVLYAASEILMKNKSADAQAKLTNANSIYDRLKGKATPATVFKVGGDVDREDDHREIELRVAYTRGVTP